MGKKMPFNIGYMQNFSPIGSRDAVKLFSCCAAARWWRIWFDAVSFAPPFSCFYGFFGYWLPGGAAFAVLKTPMFPKVSKPREIRGQHIHLLVA